ncbi:hypothetical protein HAX54_022747 [Datura stramonium]|uniref:Uncharacterized protein n=1 Tax=Datura stramonium TaxID=4076 RepID=A0ABS8S4K6_DATST|nr:hypothetical protein [Datura stramonium]
MAAVVFEVPMEHLIGDAVKKLTNKKIFYYKAPIYLQNKTQIGKDDEILSPINESLQSATDDRLILLKTVSEALKPGVLTALMGASGGWKNNIVGYVCLGSYETCGAYTIKISLGWISRNQQSLNGATQKVDHCSGTS